ncbi:magnesium protoporphyrin IX methyltransferase [Acidiphilium acidophilum]|uniref:Magnesium protoporphyrin IX methyltransferase n=1 Tax=Acidiphilium acidophilum TaxID=76588 RepID=A0AAW9DUB8_ACIAO|nr:magnesium protoporphyrin IX methyltransferase [Acidiphilium acidophilum]MDX5932134.1 magnesium protoporphyrin IX methyltransferase [Acidiphilium acidophilum]
MPEATYQLRRGEIETYFDRTAATAWARLTSDAPVSGIRARVRAGRDAMRATILSYLPDDLTGARLLDAGCGTGALSLEAAARGADVVAVDLSPTLIDLARSRAANIPAAAHIEFRAGDMLDASLGSFDFVVAMDSLIHYQRADVVASLARIAPRVRHSIIFTFAPGTPLLVTARMIGRLFPRSDRSPAIEPQPEVKLRRAIRQTPALAGLTPARTNRISRSFYISQALELSR